MQGELETRRRRGPAEAELLLQGEPITRRPTRHLSRARQPGGPQRLVLHRRASSSTEAPLPRPSRSVSSTRTKGVAPTGARGPRRCLRSRQGGGSGLQHYAGETAACLGLVSHARTRATRESTPSRRLLPKKTGSMRPNATDRWDQS